VDINYINSKNCNLLFYLYESQDKPLNGFTIDYLVKNGIDIRWKRGIRSFLEFLIEQKEEKLTEAYLKSISFNSNFIIKILSDVKKGKGYTDQEITSLIHNEYEKIQIGNGVIDKIIDSDNGYFLNLILKYKIQSSNDEILQYILHNSCIKKNIALVKKLIERNVDVNCRDKFTLVTPLMEVSFFDKDIKFNNLNQLLYDMFECLINAKADINAKDAKGKTPLMYLLESTKVSPKLIKFLIKHGANINAISDEGYSPIIYATKVNNKSVINGLLESGADASVVSKDGKSLLHHAALNGSVHLVDYLIKNKLVNDIDGVDQNYETPLILAVKSKNVDIVKYLVERGADVNHTNIIGESVLAMACYGRITKINLTILQYLIDHGANINTIYNFEENSIYVDKKVYCKETPLIFAINRKNIELVKILVENGADVNRKNDYGEKMPPLYYTLSYDYKNIDIIKYLLHHGANPNEIINDRMDTVFFHAVKNSNDPVIELLVENGADINHKNNDNNIPLGTITYKKRGKEFFEMLINDDVDFEELNKENGNSIFLNSISNFNKTLFNCIMDFDEAKGKKIDINRKGYHGNTALIYAVMSNEMEIVSRILDRNPDVNAKNDSYDTAFTLAVKKKNFELMKLLINKGAAIDNSNVQSNIEMLNCSIPVYRNVRFLIINGFRINDFIINSKLSHGKYLLSTAVRWKNYLSVKFLLENGANPYLNDSFHCIPLLELAYGGYNDKDIETSKKIVECFVAHGVDINTKNDQGRTLLFSLYQHHNVEYKKNMIRYLIEDQHVDVNIQDNEGLSFLMMAVKQTTNLDIDTIKYLVEEKKCSLDHVDHNGNSVVMHALSKGSPQVYTYFLNRCQDFTQKNNFGMNLLMGAVNNVDLGTVKKLVQQGVSLHDVDNEGRNALLYLLEEVPFIFDTVKVLKLGFPSNITPNFKYLVENGVDINCENPEGKTVLFYIHNNLNLMKYAIDHGADVQHVDHEGKTLLFYINSFSLIQYAISKGLDASIRDKEGHTAIYSKEYLPMDQLFFLVEHGGDIREYRFYIKNGYNFYMNYNMNYLRKAIHLNFNFDTPNELDEEGGKDGNVQEVFMDYIISNICHYEPKEFVDFMEKAMEKKLFDIRRKNFQGDPPLISIMRTLKTDEVPMGPEYLDLLLSMVRHGADLTDVDREGKSPLYHAMTISMDLAQKFYERGARILTQSEQGVPATTFNVKNIILHEECSDAIKCEMIKFLQQADPALDLSAKVEGDYPILLAVEQNCYMTVKYLLSQRVSTTGTNSQREGVVDLAKRMGNQAIIQLLEKSREDNGGNENADDKISNKRKRRGRKGTTKGKESIAKETKENEMEVDDNDHLISTENNDNDGEEEEEEEKEEEEEAKNTNKRKRRKGNSTATTTKSKSKKPKK